MNEKKSNFDKEGLRTWLNYPQKKKIINSVPDVKMRQLLKAESISHPISPLFLPHMLVLKQNQRPKEVKHPKEFSLEPSSTIKVF